MSKTKRYCYGYLPETDFAASETTGTRPDGRVSRTRQQAPTFVGQQKINERAIFHAISRVPRHIFLWPLGNVLTWKRKESCCSPDVLRVYADIVSCLSALWEPVGAFAPSASRFHPRSTELRSRLRQTTWLSGGRSLPRCPLSFRFVMAWTWWRAITTTTSR